MTKLLVLIGSVMFLNLGCDTHGEQKKEDKMSQNEQEKKKDKKDKKGNEKDNEENKSVTNDNAGKKEEGKTKEDYTASNVAILETWEMPTVLKEISGICWYESNKIAAVQDESGIIFIYDLVSKKVEREIPFGAKGDYEGIAVTPKSFYVLRADGTVIEVPKAGGKAKFYDTPLTVKDDTEGICYDARNQRLLISLKATSGNSTGSKNIYEFNPGTKKLSAAPLYTIDTGDQIFQTGNSKGKVTFEPSGISIHPKTGEMYLIGGSNSSLLVLNNSAKANYFTRLNPAEFVQPEGIAFSPQGELYIATEGMKDPGKIFKVDLTNKP